MYSLQFNLSVTNGVALTSVAAGLLALIRNWLNRCPAARSVSYRMPCSFIRTGLGCPYFTNLLSNNSLGTSNLLSAGWLETIGKTNLYDTAAQDLIKFSMAHDTLFDKANGKVVLGNFFFRIPPTATAGETYLSGSAGPRQHPMACGRRVYRYTDQRAPAAASPINAIKTVTVGTRKYLGAMWRRFGGTTLVTTGTRICSTTMSYRSLLLPFTA